MISAGFILLAAVILGHAVPQHVHQQRDTPPDGFKVVGVASPAEVITLRIALAQSDFAGL